MGLFSKLDLLSLAQSYIRNVLTKASEWTPRSVTRGATTMSKFLRFVKDASAFTPSSVIRKQLSICRLVKVVHCDIDLSPSSVTIGEGGSLSRVRVGSLAMSLSELSVILCEMQQPMSRSVKVCQCIAKSLMKSSVIWFRWFLQFKVLRLPILLVVRTKSFVFPNSWTRRRFSLVRLVRRDMARVPRPGETRDVLRSRCVRLVILDR